MARSLHRAPARARTRARDPLRRQFASLDLRRQFASLALRRQFASLDLRSATSKPRANAASRGAATTYAGRGKFPAAAAFGRPARPASGGAAGESAAARPLGGLLPLVERLMYTLFWDMHSGGRIKHKDYGAIIVQAEEYKATILFLAATGRDPYNITCSCCGEDYSVTEYKTFEEARHQHVRHKKILLVLSDLTCIPLPPVKN